MAPIFFVVLAGVVGGLAFAYVFSKMKRSRQRARVVGCLSYRARRRPT